MRYASSARWCSRLLGLVAGVLLAGIAVTQSHAEIDPRPSWNDGVVKQSITGFVGSVTKGGPHFAGTRSSQDAEREWAYDRNSRWKARQVIRRGNSQRLDRRRHEE